MRGSLTRPGSKDPWLILRLPVHDSDLINLVNLNIFLILKIILCIIHKGIRLRGKFRHLWISLCEDPIPGILLQCKLCALHLLSTLTQISIMSNQSRSIDVFDLLNPSLFRITNSLLPIPTESRFIHISMGGASTFLMGQRDPNLIHFCLRPTTTSTTWDCGNCIMQFPLWSRSRHILILDFNLSNKTNLIGHLLSMIQLWWWSHCDPTSCPSLSQSALDLGLMPWFDHLSGKQTFMLGLLCTLFDHILRGSPCLGRCLEYKVETLSTHTSITCTRYRSLCLIHTLIVNNLQESWERMECLTLEQVFHHGKSWLDWSYLVRSLQHGLELLWWDYISYFHRTFLVLY